MAFGENQLSPSLISLSLLVTPHPIIFQHYPVRTSNWCYPTFILDMTRSLGFGSTPGDSRPFQTRFLYGSLNKLTSPLKSNSLTHYTKGTQSPALKQAPTACTQTVSGLFHSPQWGSFHLSLTVLVHYRSVSSI